MDFPRVPVQPGRYATEWFIDDRTIAGEIELASAQPPLLTFFGEAKPIIWKSEGRLRSANYPSNHHVPEIIGRLRTGYDVIVTDADLSVWAPERTHGSARFAVVGLGIARAARRYRRLRLQLSGSDLLFGVPPVESIQFPKPEDFQFEGHFGVTLNRQSVQTWQDAANGMTITCSYEGNFSLTNRYRHQLAFAPVIEFDGEPRAVDEWMDLWLRPLLGLTALATRAPQRISWLVVRAAHEDPTDQTDGASGVIFGSGISQEPYQADEPPVRTDPAVRPLLTLKTLPAGLPGVLRAWRDLEASANPFLELYRSVLFQPDLAPRARFLYLIQALEGLHAAEHKAADANSQASFQARREAALDELSRIKLTGSTLRFIKDSWSRRKSDSLDRRLHDLIAVMPQSAQDELEHQRLPLSLELERDGENRLEGKLRRLRNDLSHGARRVDEDDLAPWVAVLERVAQHHLLSRLGIE